MKYNICLISSDKTFLERYSKYINQNLKNEIDLTLCENENEYYHIKKEFDATFVVDDYKDEPEYFSLLGCEDKFRISKYQKPNEVCIKIMSICDEIKNNQDINIRKNSKQGDWLYYQIPSSKSIDRYSYKMITQNNIPGLLKISLEENKLTYNIKDKVTLGLLTEDKKNNKRVLGILTRIKEICDNLENYMLDVGKLSLKPDEVYIDKTTFEPELLFIPLIENDGKSETVVMNKDSNATFVDNTVVEEYGKTVVFEDLQEAARQSIERQIQNKNSHE